MPQSLRPQISAFARRSRPRRRNTSVYLSQRERVLAFCLRRNPTKASIEVTAVFDPFLRHPFCWRRLFCRFVAYTRGWR